MAQFYITLGQSQVHSIDGRTWDRNGVLEVVAPNEKAAIAAVKKHFGHRWSFIYTHSEMDFSYYKKGIVALLEKSFSFPEYTYAIMNPTGWCAKEDGTDANDLNDVYCTSDIEALILAKTQPNSKIKIFDDTGITEKRITRQLAKDASRLTDV